MIELIVYTLFVSQETCDICAIMKLILQSENEGAETETAAGHSGALFIYCCIMVHC